MIDSFRYEYKFLSNFYPTTILYEGIRYPSSEHAYQAAKTSNIDLRLEISQMPNPQAAKKKGWQLRLRSDWKDIKIATMKSILKIKFSRKYLKNKLLATGDELLLEGNWWHDNYWGSCTCTFCEDTTGLNHLGKLLMEIREEIRL